MMQRFGWAGLWVFGAVLASAQEANQEPAQESPPSPTWDARHAEHLLNRAGFGANTATVEHALALGLAGTVDELLRVEPWLEEPFYARKHADGDLAKTLRTLPDAERERRLRELHDEDQAQERDFLDWWIERMLAGDEPLRERMVLFWHGHFTSSMEVVKSSYEMIQQNQLFRRHALGSFRELLHGVARDPAMLVYLDNDSSRKAHPNENFARELMELYTLGEGNYSEQDVREVARAFTGWGQRNGRFYFDAQGHDGGKKRVLGVEGKLDGEDVIDILLAQEACARHLAHALMTYFEGREPAPERLASYAAELRDSGYRIDRFLRRLFLDPEFHSEATLGTRVSSPLDYLVGTARRLGIAPEPHLVVIGAALLGQKLFFPPSVRGWEGGDAWANGSSLLLRGELSGLFLGTVSGRDLLGTLRDGTEERLEEGEAAARRKLPPDLRELGRADLRPRLNLVQRLSRNGPRGDEDLARALAEECLSLPPSEELVERLARRLTDSRARFGMGKDEAWSEYPDFAEPLLRALAQEILSLPEAQLD